jgi:hypothetical protein
MRLNGWQRFGIAASVIWAVGAPMYLDHAAREEASAAFLRYYRACRDVPSNCSEQASRQKDIVPRYRFLRDKAKWPWWHFLRLCLDGFLRMHLFT